VLPGTNADPTPKDAVTSRFRFVLIRAQTGLPCHLRTKNISSPCRHPRGTATGTIRIRSFAWRIRNTRQVTRIVGRCPNLLPLSPNTLPHPAPPSPQNHAKGNRVNRGHPQGLPPRTQAGCTDDLEATRSATAGCRYASRAHVGFGRIRQPGRTERRAAAAIAFNGAGGAEAAPPRRHRRTPNCAGRAIRFGRSPQRGCCDVHPTLPLRALAGNALSSSIRPSRLPSFERSRRGAGKDRFEPSASIERNVPAGSGVASRHDAGIPYLVLNRLRFLVRARTREHAAPVCHSAPCPAPAGDSRQLPLGSSWQRVRFASERPGF
jgi:hypothetical protein